MKTSDNYCDFETSLLLKEVGFDEPCKLYHYLINYDNKSQLVNANIPLKNSEIPVYLGCSAPTWLGALEWLEKQGFIFDFQFIYGADCYVEIIGKTLFVYRERSHSIIESIQTAVKKAARILKEKK